jgi:hypothetical protein
MSSKKIIEQNQPEKSNMDLFDNPMINSIKKQMSPEQLENYKKIGEQMYNNVDFQNCQVLNNIPPPMVEALAYISEGLKSGLHPSYLDEDEIKVLKECYGEEWYTKWNYKKEGDDYVIIDE